MRGALALLDLSANRRFAVLDAAARSRLIDRITSATASGTLRTVLLNDLQLDNSNAPAVASLLRSSSTGNCVLRAVALERNLLSEEGLLLLSEALRGSAERGDFSGITEDDDEADVPEGTVEDLGEVV